MRLLSSHIDIRELAEEAQNGPQFPAPPSFAGDLRALIDEGLLAEIGGTICISDKGRAALAHAAERLLQEALSDQTYRASFP